MSNKAASEHQGRKHPSNEDATRTSKTWKALARDRFKHSHLGAAIPNYRHRSGGSSLTLKKGGGGGKFTAGKAVESELEQSEDFLDPHDPNYDEQEIVSGLSSLHFQPSARALSDFTQTFADYQRFKSHVVSELPNYLAETKDVLRAAQQFAESLKDLDLQDYHYDFVYLAIRWDIESDNKADNKSQRERIVKLIKYLHDHNGCLLTPAQIDCGLRKLHNTLDDLLLEYPAARTTLHNYVLACETAGITENTWQDELEELEKQAEVLKDQETDKKLRGQITKMIESYLKSEDLDSLASAIQKLQAPQMHFEIVKMAMLIALERGNNKHSELISEMLAAFTGDLISYEATQHGIMHFLEEVEEIEDEYTNVLCFLSSFVARAVADHVIPLQLLNNNDLIERKPVAQIMLQTRHLLKGKGAAAKLQKVWTLSEASFASPAHKPQRSLSTGSNSSFGSINSPLSLGSRKLSASSTPTGSKVAPAFETRRKSVSGENAFSGFVIGAKKPGTAAYEIEQAKKATPSSQTRQIKEPSAEEAMHLAEKDRLDSFGYYDPGQARAARNSPFAARSRYM